MIAFSGISGSGKSTIAKILAEQLLAECVSEPEEINWPEITKDRKKYGHSTALLEFRQIWAKQFIDANLLDKEGKLVFLDTYFFKISAYYLDKPGMGWLIPPKDPYLPILKELFILDLKHFPDANCVILLDISFENWKLFLKARGRDLDNSPGFLESYELISRYIREATIQHCKNHNIKLIQFPQIFGDPYAQAKKLQELLIKEKIIKAKK